MYRTALIATAIVAAAPACRQTSALYCDTNADCTNPAYPLCDVDGTSAASDGVSHTCVSDVADAGADSDADASVFYDLTVSLAGEGTGRVTSSPPGIDCGGTCVASFPFGTAVTLTATPASGSKHVDWSGECIGSGLTCNVAIGGERSVGVTFEPIELVQIAAGGLQTCVLLETGAVRCWGASPSIGHGTGDSIGDDEPASTAGDVVVGGRVTQLATGNSHTCAVLETSAVRCWGNPAQGRLGYANSETIGDNETPASAGDVDIGATVSQVTAGVAHNCAVLSSASVKCWGLGVSGQLGYGNTETIGDDEAPATVGEINFAGIAVQIAAGGDHTCALSSTGGVRCWGAGNLGQLGYGNTDTRLTPGLDVEVGGTVVQIAAGGQHTCARLETGAVRCWGIGGALGYGNNISIGDDETPATAGDVPLGGLATKIAAGGNHTCALLESGAVRCWGYGGNGQLGYGDTASIGDDETPASVGDVPIGGAATDISAGGAHTCAILDMRRVRCWGWGAYGALGYGNTDNIGDDETPASVGDVPVF
jgi:alpha-tubulin suppressor-like RCC1 family protein